MGVILVVPRSSVTTDNSVVETFVLYCKRIRLFVGSVQEMSHELRASVIFTMVPRCPAQGVTGWGWASTSMSVLTAPPVQCVVKVGHFC